MDASIGSVSLHFLDWAVIGLYFVVLVSIGFYFYRKVEGLEDYLVAGRALTLPILAVSMIAAYYDGMYFFADGGLMYSEGIVADMAYYPPYYFLMIILTFFLIPRLGFLGEISMPDVLDRFYGKVTRIFGAFGSFLYCIPVMQLMCMGLVFNVLLGWPIWLGALIGGVLSILNTLLGGLMALTIQDLIKFVLMFFGILVALPIGLKYFGGWSNVLALNPEWHLDPTGGYLSWMLLFVYGASAITLLVEPVFYQRFFAARDHKTAVRAFMTVVIFWMFFDRVLVATGLIAWAKYPGFLIAQDKAIFTTIINYLPIGLAGLLVAGVIATVVSTIDAYALCGAANLSYDIIKSVFKPDMSENRAVWLTRVMLVFTFILSFALMFVFPRIMLVWLLQAAILTSVAVIPILGAFLWPFRKSTYGGMFSAGFGLVATITYIIAVFALGEPLPGWDTMVLQVNLFGTTIHLWAEMVMYVSIIASLLAYIIGNLFGPPLDPKLADERRVLS